jgi:ABC-type multidrug transport system fused ATPase/permease subunit
MLIGMLFEMAGLGIMIPALSLMLNSDIGKEYPAVQPYLEALGNPTHNQLVLWGMLTMVMVYLIKAIYLGFLAWRQSCFSVELSAYFSRELFLGYMRQPYTFHLQRNSAELLRNIQSEASFFSTLAQSVIGLLIEFSVVVGIVFMLIIVEPIGAAAVTFFLGGSAIIFHRITKNKLLKWGEKRQVYASAINQHLLQGLGGIKDVKMMGRENYFYTECTNNISANSKMQAKVQTFLQIPRLYLELLAVMGLAGLVVLMMAQNKPLDLLIPTLGVFVAAAFRLIPSFNRIIASSQQLRYGQPVLEVLYNEFRQIRNSIDNEVKTFKINFRSKLEVKKLNFHYSNNHKNTLEDVSIYIKKGESVGFIGPSGSGKSTLVDVILGLLTPDSGEITVDGQEINKNIRSWQDQIGYIPQTIYLTDDTLRRNVAFGLPNEQIDNIAVARAIKASQLDEFVQSLPDKLETYVGERGIRLSGGQRQRIGIARALYHDPAILVLDEATSSLDSTTERGVMQAVSALQGSKTLLIVAHRLSTVENCDRIYKLNHGKVVGEGTPKKMLAT